MTALVAGWLGTWLAVWLYFAPMAFCHVFYFARTVRNWSRDRKARDAGRAYDAEHAVRERWRAERNRIDAEAMSKWYEDNPMPPLSDGRSYVPTDTVGAVIGRVVVSWLPVGNLWAALFDLGPEVFGRFFTWVGRVFDQPLVPGDRK